MTSEINDFTWQSLHEYIERRIAGVLNVLQSLRDDPRLQNLDERYTTSFERELEMLRQCLALVIEMQSRESLQDISPILSLNIIRLRCRYRYVEQDGFLEFAWISPIAERKYSLVKIGMNESPESGRPHSIDADLIQIVQEVEKLVKENCANESQ
jgi:hypothetical protein